MSIRPHSRKAPPHQSDSPTFSDRVEDDDDDNEFDEFYLGTVGISLDGLTAIWSLGTNRNLDNKHVDDLVDDFLQYGVKRHRPENHAKVGCSGVEWEKIWEAMVKERRIATGQALEMVRGELRSSIRRRDQPRARDWPIVRGWTEKCGRPAELMDGQHRVEGMRRYLSRRWPNDEEKKKENDPATVETGREGPTTMIARRSEVEN